MSYTFLEISWFPSWPQAMAKADGFHELGLGPGLGLGRDRVEGLVLGPGPGLVWEGIEWKG